MPNLGLIAAMRTELPRLLKDATGDIRIGDKSIKAAVSGIGLRKARSTTHRVCSAPLDSRPGLLINAGFCGAVRDDCAVGHLVIANRIRHGRREIAFENSLIEKIASYLAGFDCRAGQVQTFRWPVLSRAGIFGDTLAVDMEAFAIAQTAATYQIPTVVVKAVSDIVPRNISLFGLLNWMRRLKAGANTARTRLDQAVTKILEARDLFDEFGTRQNTPPPAMPQMDRRRIKMKE